MTDVLRTFCAIAVFVAIAVTTAVLLRVLGVG